MDYDLKSSGNDQSMESEGDSITIDNNDYEDYSDESNEDNLNQGGQYKSKNNQKGKNHKKRSTNW